MSEDTKKNEQAEQKPTKTAEPASTDLKEEDLEQVSGGMGWDIPGNVKI
jgi:hypothetical protein